jgi:hypothetical protein
MTGPALSSFAQREQGAYISACSEGSSGQGAESSQPNGLAKATGAAENPLNLIRVMPAKGQGKDEHSQSQDRDAQGHDGSAAGLAQDVFPA